MTQFGFIWNAIWRLSPCGPWPIGTIRYYIRGCSELAKACLSGKGDLSSCAAKQSSTVDPHLQQPALRSDSWNDFCSEGNIFVRRLGRFPVLKMLLGPIRLYDHFAGTLSPHCQF